MAAARTATSPVFTDHLRLGSTYCAEPQKAPSHEGRASEEDVSLGGCLFTAHDAPARGAGDIGDCRHSSVEFLRIRCRYC